MWAVNWQLCKCNRWHDSLCWISITDLFVVNILVISISFSLKWGLCSDQKRANFAVAKWNLIGRPSNLINDKYHIEYENETRFFGVTCSCTSCYCWHHLSTKFWLGREPFFFFQKEAYYLEENAKIFVLTNSFLRPCQCLHKMMNEIPLNKIEI